jgi:NAD(P)-dependent dehydrogenase (short-subunit alcohol dehydrogenase family)
MVAPPAPPVALVTGGARRIGRAIVEDLARHGWAVAIHCHQSRGQADSLAAAIREGGGRSAVVAGDLAETATPARIIAEAQAALGVLTLLVNSAAVFEFDAVGALDRPLWDRQLAINLAAPVFLAEAFAGQCPAGVEGNVVNLLDQSIWRPRPRNYSYEISKAGLAAATLSLAQALAPAIRVNGIAPGPALPSDRQSAADFHRLVASVPLHRAPELTEFGRTIRYIVETRSITGQIIALDGGQHLARTTP